MVFGRGGGGGVINRVTEQANGLTERELAFTVGEYGQKRGAIDVGQALRGDLSVRLNAMYETSDDYRKFKDLDRYGINPTATYDISDATRLSLGYEHFDDQRTVDRGVPSVDGEPIHGVVRTFYGNPQASHAEAKVNLTSAVLEHTFSPTLSLRNQTLYGDYDKFYQNVFPGAVTGDTVAISAYNNATQRDNLFNQTNLTWNTQTWSIGHTLLSGVEFSRQTTDNFRNTGYFDPVANVTTVDVPLSDPITHAPLYFRQSATDADNHSTTDVAAIYFQDQIQLTEQFLAIAGVRFDQFQIDFDNKRNGQKFNREDNLTELRYGLIYKPIANVSLYVSRSNSYLPSSGDQFSSLDATSESLKPEEFTNSEVGAKWDVTPAIALTAAVYRLDRENSRAPGSYAGNDRVDRKPAHRRLRIRRERIDHAAMGDDCGIRVSGCRDHVDDVGGAEGSRGGAGSGALVLVVEPLPVRAALERRCGCRLSGRGVHGDLERGDAAEHDPGRRGAVLRNERSSRCADQRREPAQREVLRDGERRQQHHTRHDARLACNGDHAFLRHARIREWLRLPSFPGGRESE